MERFTKRGLSLLLALVMCVSLLSGLSFVSSAATVDYVYGSWDKFTNVIYNWGIRGVDAICLSPNAEDYYEAKGTSYEELAALAGNANTASTPNSPLYAELRDLMSDGVKEIDYDDARGLMVFTDSMANSGASGGAISCFYSAGPLGPAWDGGATWNREHVWPQSKLTDGGDSDEDLMMLRPANSRINSGRGNKPFGDSNGYYMPNGSLAAIGYDIRGDVARVLLYGYVRWDNTQHMWGESGVIESLSVLLNWMVEDPVDTWEMGRNDSMESINGARNVFVDYPELAFELFEQEIPTDIETPSTGNGYQVNAVSSNAARGSVKYAGNIIYVTPATGYEYAGYRVTSGSANITVQGNALIVDPSSDCTITVDFQARSSKTVTFMANGVRVGTMNPYTGDSIILPGSELATLNGYTFAGWVESEIIEETDKAPAFYAAGASYEVKENVCLYALFTREGEGTGATTSYTLYTGALTDGDYIITYGNNAMTATKKNNKLVGTPVTPVNNAINNPSANMIWTIQVSNGKAAIYNSAVKYVLGSTANNTNLTFPTEAAGWNLTNGDGVYSFTNPSMTTRALCYNASANYFANYALKDYDPKLTLYKANSAAQYYTTGNAAPVEQGTVEYWKDDELVDTFATVEEALLAANEGTVILTENIAAGSVIVQPGVTLDLNGKILTAELLVAMTDAVVTDGGADCIGGGSLKIAKENLVLAQDNKGVIPVWNGTDGYVLTKVSYQQMAKTAGEGAAQYIFLPAFSNAAAAALLADGGADNGVNVKVGLNWNDGQCQQFYTYSDDLVAQVFTSGGKLVFSLTITGIAGISDMDASAMIVTDSGAQGIATGAAITAG